MGQAVFQLDRLIFKHNDDERFIKCTCDISTTIVNTICNSSQYFSVKWKYYIIKMSFILKYDFIIEFLYLYENIEYCNFLSLYLKVNYIIQVQIGRKAYIIKFIYFLFKIQKNVDKSWKCINIHVYNTMTTYIITLRIVQIIK